MRNRLLWLYLLCTYMGWSIIAIAFWIASR